VASVEHYHVIKANNHLPVVWRFLYLLAFTVIWTIALTHPVYDILDYIIGIIHNLASSPRIIVHVLVIFEHHQNLVHAF
jgi:hypothetical protein